MSVPREVPKIQLLYFTCDISGISDLTNFSPGIIANFVGDVQREGTVLFFNNFVLRKFQDESRRSLHVANLFAKLPYFVVRCDQELIIVSRMAQFISDVLFCDIYVSFQNAHSDSVFPDYYPPLFANISRSDRAISRRIIYTRDLYHTCAREKKNERKWKIFCKRKEEHDYAFAKVSAHATKNMHEYCNRTSNLLRREETFLILILL